MTDSTLDLNINTRSSQRDVDRLTRALADLERHGDDAAGSVDELNTGVSGLTRNLRFAATAMAAFATGAMAQGVIQLTGSFQSLERSLGVVFGSMEQGKQVFKDIQQLALTTPFQIEDLAESVVKLKASGLEPTNEQLQLFADVASVTTDQLGSLQAMTDLFSRSVAGGLGLEDLTRLADRGIPIFGILEEQLGLTRKEVTEFGQSAKGSAEILEVLTGALNEEFGGAATAAAGDLLNEISNLQIAFKLLVNEVAGGAILDGITKAVEKMSKAIDGVTASVKNFKPWLLSIVEDSDKLAIALGVLATVTIPILVKVILGGLVPAIKMVGLAFLAMAKSMLANPFLMITAAIAAVTVALYLFREDIYVSVVKTFTVTLPNAFDHFLMAMQSMVLGARELLNRMLSELDSAVSRVNDTINTMLRALGRDEVLFDPIRIDTTRTENRIEELKSAIDSRLADWEPPEIPDLIGRDHFEGMKDTLRSFIGVVNKTDSAIAGLGTGDALGGVDSSTASGGTGKGADAVTKIGEEAKKTTPYIRNLALEFDYMGNAIQSASSNATYGLLDLATGAATAGEAFSRMAESILSDIARMIIQQQILNALQGLAGGVNWAGYSEGGVFSGGKATAFAKGGVVSGPTVFPMANGTGLMGEAGPEAVMPLQRMGDGKLGVAMAGGGGVTVNIHNSTGNSEVETRTSSDGMTIDVLINNTVKGGLADGSFDRQLSSNFGVSRKGM